MSNVTYADLLGKIRDHGFNMDSWWDAMDDTGAEWLLIMTLACWGVSNHFFQVFGLLLTAAFFADKLSKLHNGGTFPRIERELSKMIAKSELNLEEQQKLLLALNEVKKKRGIRNFFSKNWRFIGGYTFLSFSIIEVIFVHAF